MKRKNILFVVVILFFCQKVDAQFKLLLNNTFISDVQYDNQQNLLCVGGFFINSVPAVAQKLSPTFEYLWPNDEFGVWLTHPFENDETGNRLMLQQSDGSVFFCIEYNKYMGVFAYGDSLNPAFEILYYSYPVIQKTSADGDVLWGENGIQLSNHNILCDISAGIKLLDLSFDAAGNVTVIWTYTFAENADRTDEFKGTFMQKIDPVSGELLHDSTGIEIAEENANAVYKGHYNNYYIVKIPASTLIEPEIINIDENGNELWSIDMSKEFGNFSRSVLISSVANVTSDGDLFMLYSSNPTFGAYIYSDGNIKFKDKIILPGSVRITQWTPFMDWGDDQWILFSGENLYHFSTDGEQLWDATGVEIFSPISGVVFYDMEPMSDNNSILLFYSTITESGSSYRILKMQKIMKDGSFAWHEEGIELIERVGGSAYILQENNGGAYIITNASAVYEPEFRPRGSYIIRIDENGNIITKVPISNNYCNHNPETFVLVKNYPNPFSENTHFIINNNSLLSDTPAIFVIYNILGKEVIKYELTNENLTNGMELSWDGKDQFGRRVSPGVYFYRLTTNNYSKMVSGKLILIK